MTTAQRLTIKDPSDFESVVARYFQQEGYEVIMPPANTRGYDIELRLDNECIAVQVKNHKARCNIAQVRRFKHFLERPLAARFTKGWFISASGFHKATLTHIHSEQPENLRLGMFEFERDRVQWVYPKLDDDGDGDEEITIRKYIGIFTCKGGVGKTTVAAHLAGAFALMGHDVILLDLDPDRNLRKLFSQDVEEEDASIFVPPVNRNDDGATITVLNSDEWEEERRSEKIIICDCSPVLSENPKSLVEKFDYCIIPTTLNPLGISKGGDVIIRTFEYIRACNQKAEMFTLINSYNPTQSYRNRNRVLYDLLRKSLASYISSDRKCKLIDPDAAKIRRSDKLLYWGYHIVEGTEPQLAFNNTAGVCHPKTDFLQLAEYLEDHTEIDQLRQQESRKAVTR